MNESIQKDDPRRAEEGVQKKGKRTRVLITGVGIGGCLVGVLIILACLLPIIGIIQNENAPRCTPPIGNFSESDLIGTWVEVRAKSEDTLIIRADGTYKQIVHIEYAELPPTDYESDWQPWRLEYSKDNIPYLHLTGYAFCGMNSAIPCSQRDGDGHDFCQNKYVPMNSEGILIVLGGLKERPSASGPRYYYFLFYPLGSENSYAYSYQEP